MRKVWSRLTGEWCQLMHPAPMWPVHGYYRCPRCLRSYAVPWEVRDGKRTSPVSAQMFHDSQARAGNRIDWSGDDQTAAAV